MLRRCRCHAKRMRRPTSSGCSRYGGDKAETPSGKPLRSDRRVTAVSNITAGYKPCPRPSATARSRRQSGNSASLRVITTYIARPSPKVTAAYWSIVTSTPTARKNLRPTQTSAIQKSRRERHRWDGNELALRSFVGDSGCDEGKVVVAESSPKRSFANLGGASATVEYPRVR